MTSTTTQSYEGGLDGNILYRSRKTIKVGGTEKSIYRSTLFFDIRSFIENSLQSVDGYTAGNPYNILNGTLSLTSAEGKTSGTLYAFMLPLGASADETATWYVPSETTGSTWQDGGSVEPLAEGIIPEGYWNGNTVSFDMTPFLNIWLAYSDSNLGIMLTSTEDSSDIWEFYSQQAESPLLGVSPQSNCVFLGAGDTNSLKTEGIFVQVKPQSPYLVIKNAETSTTGTQRWSTFNASASIGSTFTMFAPDVNTNSAVYTLIDKRNDGEFVVSGSTAGFSTEIYTSMEFDVVSAVPTGSGIVEFINPSNSLVVDLQTLLPDDPVIFEYQPNIYPNNAKSFTVEFYSDERKQNNRIRLYLKQATASENRTGLPTIVKKSSIRPRLSLNLSV
jgi:hypothetical protein